MRRMSRAVGAVSGLVLVSILAASSAAAEEKSTKPRIAVIEFKSLPGHSAPAPLEILGFAWGDSSVAQHRATGSNQLSMDDTAGKEAYRANDRLRTAGPTNGNATAGDPDRPVIADGVPNPPASPGANETISIGGGRTETASGQATGKRQHMPIRTRSYYDQPQGKGSVWIRVGTPWSACRAGARYPSLTLANAAAAYVLEDVTVASCGGSGAQEMAFTYKKVTVRGWDPEKKEE